VLALPWESVRIWMARASELLPTLPRGSLSLAGWPGRLASRPGVWALADQAASSLGNALTTLALARSLVPSEYGVYTLLFGLMWYIMNSYGAVVLYPLSVRGAAADQRTLGRLAAEALVCGAPLLLVLGLVMVPAAAVNGRGDIGWWAALAIVAWQLQETLRRALQAHLRHRGAIVGDALSYLGQAAILWGLVATGRLSVELTFAVVALTSAAAGIVQAWQLRLGAPTLDGLRETVVSAWRLGRWLLLSFVLNGSAFLVLPWVLAFAAGPASVADVQAANYPILLTNALLLGTGNFLLPVTARAHANDGLTRAVRVGLAITLRSTAPLVLYLAALALWPELALRVFYGPASPYLHLGLLLRILLVGWLFNFLSTLLLVILQALRENRRGFIATAAGALTVVFVGAPLTLGLQAEGLALGQLAANVLRTGVLVAFLVRLRARPRDEARLSHPGA